MCHFNVTEVLSKTEAIRGLGSVGGTDKARLCVLTWLLM